MDMHSDGGLVISRADSRPMYVQLMEQIRRRVALEEWLPGQEIPSIRQLAVDTRVSVITVKRAYLELEREGVIVTRQGRGSFVAERVDLGPSLVEKDLDENLRRAALLAAQLGWSKERVVARLIGISTQEADQDVAQAPDGAKRED